MSDALYNALGTNDATQVAAVLSSMEDDVNSTENARLSPLGFYLQHGDDPQADIVQLLINAGAGVNNIGDGCCALIPAMNGRDDPALFVLLLNAGADPNHDNGAPLRWAIRAAEPVFVQALLSHGADKALVDADGLSLQDMGCASARPGISELF